VVPQEREIKKNAGYEIVTRVFFFLSRV
jgi:hypothetical protein